MRISIGLKIYGIAIFLAAIMVAAAVASEARVRKAEVRTTLLVEHLIPLTRNMAELRALMLEEEIRLRRSVVGSTDASTNSIASINGLFSTIRSQIAEVLETDVEVGTKLLLTDLGARLDDLKVDHGRVEQLATQVAQQRRAGETNSEEELRTLFNGRAEMLRATTARLNNKAAKTLDAFGKDIEAEEARAIAFEHVATAAAAGLGLVLAGLMIRALLGRLKALRRAAMAVGAGDLNQVIPISGRDEVADLAETFNRMVEQLHIKERTEAVFGRFLDPRVVQSLVEATGEDANDIAAPSRQEATILFSDIAGYTHISEQLTPTNLVRLMNAYFERASEPVAAQGGVLDKFIGDAVMAFWCAPFVDQNKIAIGGCRAALEQRAILQGFQKEIPEVTGMRTGAPAVDTRIGLATGEVIVGSIGSQRNRNYTVIGDAVNLSSRLESANKIYGTHTLICERTRELIGDQFTVRELDRLIVVGKTTPVSVFELVSEEVPLPNIARALAHFAEGLEHYRASRWEEASQSFEACLEAKPDDPPTQVFVERIARYRSEPPPAGWQGIWHAQGK